MRAAAVLVAMAATARAEPLVLDDGELRLDVALEAGLIAPYAHPLALAPDLWWGATPRLTIGLIHSSASVDQIDARASFCLRSGDYGCAHLYLGSGVDARYLALDGPVEVAPRVRALVRETEPFEPAVTLGALVRWRFAARWSLTGDPFLQLGLANTDRGNRAQLWLPLYLQWRWLWLHTGWNSELATIGDGWHVPIALGGRYAITDDVAVSLEAGFSTLLGPQNTPKERAAILTVSLRR